VITASPVQTTTPPVTIKGSLQSRVVILYAVDTRADGMRAHPLGWIKFQQRLQLISVRFLLAEEPHGRALAMQTRGVSDADVTKRQLGWYLRNCAESAFAEDIKHLLAPALGLLTGDGLLVRRNRR
jgi:hypothetical protein